MSFETFTFLNSSGTRLSARIDHSQEKPPRAFAIFAHCFTCTKNFKAVANISNALTRHDISVMRFDFSGLGESEGDFSDTNFSSNVADLVDASAYLARHHQAPRLLVGHSFGGTACLKAALDISSVAAVVTIGSPAEPRHVKRHLSHARDQIERHGEALVTLEGRPFKIKRQFLDDIEQINMKVLLPELNCPILILHSPRDEIVNIDNAGHLFRHARHPKSFVSLDDADHMISDSNHSAYVGRLIAAWSDRYL